MSVSIQGLTKLNNVIISSTAGQAPTNYWTVFGDMPSDAFPTIEVTGVTDFYVKKYIAGVFAVSADLANLNITDVRAGVRYTGDETGGVMEVILSGIVVQTANYTGPAENIGGTLQTAYGNWPAAYLGSNAGYVDYLGIYVGHDGDYVSIASDVPDTVLTFDTKDVKFAWYVDTNTGLTPGTLLDGYPIYAAPATMYTTVTPQSVFNWQTILQDGYLLNNVYDSPTSTKLNVKLGGYALSWTDSTGVADPNTNGIYYDLNYPVTPPISLDLDGGWYDAAVDPADIETGGTNNFQVTGAVADNYVQPDKADTGAGVAAAGPRSYPGIAASKYKGYIQAVNYGLPILYEQWYSN